MGSTAVTIIPPSPPKGVAFRIVQPYGRDVGRQSATVSGHATVAEAFAALDVLTEQMVRTGVKPDTVTLIVLDASGAIMARPGAHWAIA